jgi:hypothetical protein
MARFRYAIALESVPRSWFEETVGLGHATLGEYLTPGSWQELDEGLQIVIDEWDRHRDSAGSLHFADSHGAMVYRARLTSATEPRRASLLAEFRLAAPFGLRWLTKGKGDVQLDLERWWAGADRTGGEPAITGWVRFGPAHASFAFTPAPDPSGRWLVTGSGTLRGRGVLWPLVSLGFLLARPMLRRQLAAGLDEFAERWNHEVPLLLSLSPDDLRDRFLEELTERRPM